MATDTTYQYTMYEEAAAIRFAEYMVSEERLQLIVQHPVFDPESVMDRWHMVTHADVCNWQLKEATNGKQ